MKIFIATKNQKKLRDVYCSYGNNCIDFKRYCRCIFKGYFKGFKEHSYCINSFGRLVELPKGSIIEKIVNGEKILLFKNLITGKIYIINDRGMLENEVSDSLWNHSEM